MSKYEEGRTQQTAGSLCQEPPSEPGGSAPPQLARVAAGNLARADEQAPDQVYENT
jgi:hypothetical protein